MRKLYELTVFGEKAHFISFEKALDEAEYEAFEMCISHKQFLEACKSLKETGSYLDIIEIKEISID